MTVTIRVSREWHQTIKKEAVRNRRTIQGQAEVMLQKSLEKTEGGKHGR